MKTTIFILTALFIMNSSLLTAGNPKTSIGKANGNTFDISYNNNYPELATATPKEAFFNDIEPKPLSEITRLAPITPKEAPFEEIKSEFNIQPINPFLLQNMAPVTPREAEFEDAEIEKITGIDQLAPSSPLIADFEE